MANLILAEHTAESSLFKIVDEGLDLETQLTSCLREHLKMGDPGLGIKSPS